MYLVPSSISPLGERQLTGVKPAIEICRHKTHHFESAKQDSESRYGPRDGTGHNGQVVAGPWECLSSPSQRPQGLVSLRGQCRQTISPQLSWEGSLEQGQSQHIPEECKLQINCLFMGQLVCSEACQLCVLGCSFVNSIAADEGILRNSWLYGGDADTEHPLQPSVQSTHATQRTGEGIWLWRGGSAKQRWGGHEAHSQTASSLKGQRTFVEYTSAVKAD